MTFFFLHDLSHALSYNGMYAFLLFDHLIYPDISDNKFCIKLNHIFHQWSGAQSSLMFFKNVDSECTQTKTTRYSK